MNPKYNLHPSDLVPEFRSLQRGEAGIDVSSAQNIMADAYENLTRIFEPFMERKFPMVIIVAVREKENGDVVLYAAPASNPRQLMTIGKRFLNNPDAYKPKRTK